MSRYLKGTGGMIVTTTDSVQLKSLRVLHINKFHYLKGGSERVYFGTADVLKRYGHKAIFFSMSHHDNLPCSTSDYFMPDVDLNSNDRNPINQLKIALRVLYSFESKRRLSRLLDEHPVDIAHLHNIHHQISPSILHELKRRKIPVVMTLHDYKMVCASYSLLTNERPCEVCCGKKYLKAVSRQCVKNSYTKSILAAIEMYLHHKLLDIYDTIDTFISPSLFLKNKLGEMGFKKQIVHLPNFVKNFENGEERSDEENRKEISIVYFGRLSREKGLLTLLKAVKILQDNHTVTIKVNIIGEGPLKDTLRKNAQNEKIHNIQFLGYMKDEALYREIKKSRVVILPSEWYENNPISVLESFALGKPVIGTNIGGIPELVKTDITGLIFEPGNAKDLAEKIKYVLDNPEKIVTMGENARSFVEQELNAEKYYQGLMRVYRSVIEKYR